MARRAARTDGAEDEYGLDRAVLAYVVARSRSRLTDVVWFSANLTIACLSLGTLGPLFYALDLRSCAGIIFGMNLLSCGLPAYLATFGPKTGLRQMAIARWSFGYIPVLLPTILNMAGMLCFSMLNAIVGGSALVEASRDRSLSINAGIIIVSLCALAIAFAGLRVLHLFERVSWIPVFIAMVILAGCAGAGGKLANRGDEPAPTAANVLSFVSLIVGWTLSWAPLASDFFAYHSPAIPSWKIFLSTFGGLYLSCAPVQFFGAALMAATAQNAAWEDGFTANGVGGLIGGVLFDAGLGNFGRFLLVIFGLGMISNNAPTVYALSLNAQVLVPWLVAVPRFVFCALATAIYLPLGIVGSSAFYATLNSFTGLLSYWSAILVGILAVEHLVIRRRDFGAYEPADYMSLHRLPPGIAALVASVATGAVLTTGMDQVWYRGPIAQAISGPDAEVGGDVGFELALVVAPLLYLPLRLLERRYFRR